MTLIVQGRHKGKTHEVWDDIELQDYGAARRFIRETKRVHRDDDRFEYRIVQIVKDWE